jgi:hypothetical protein
LFINVERRICQSFNSRAGQDNESWDKRGEELSSRFVSNWLPEPFNDWSKDWRMERPLCNPQQSNSVDCGFYCILVALHLALGREIPPSFDDQFLRAFVHSLCTNINSVAAIDAASYGVGDVDKAVTSAADNRPDAPLDSSLPFLHALPPQCLPEYQNEVPGVPAPITLEIISQLQEAANSYIDTKLSELSYLRAAADPFVTLIQALVEAGQSMPERLKQLERDEITLQKIEETAKDLREVNKQHELKNMANGFLADIRRQKKRAKYARQLQSAAVLCKGPDVLKRLETTYNEYLRNHTMHDHCSLKESDGPRVGFGDTKEP